MKSCAGSNVTLGVFTEVQPGWDYEQHRESWSVQNSHLTWRLQGSENHPIPRPPLFSPSIHHLSCISHFPLSSDLHVYKMEWFLSPSGEISCPRLSFCIQDIRIKVELDTHTLHHRHCQSLLSWTTKKNPKKLCHRMFCGGCYYDLEAVCREYLTCANGGFFCWHLFCSCVKTHSVRSLSKNFF